MATLGTYLRESRNQVPNREAFVEAISRIGRLKEEQKEEDARKPAKDEQKAT